MSKIVVVGSLNADLVQPVKRLPHPGETILAEDLQVIPGGKGANQAVAAARLGASVRMIGELGEDNFASVLQQSLQAAGVDATGVRQSAGATGTAVIFVLPSGESLIVVSPAANGRLTPQKLGERWSAVSSQTILLCQLETPMPAVFAALTRAREAGATTILDPAPAQTLTPDLLRTVTYLTPNQSEAAILLSSSEPESIEDAHAAARKLLEGGSANVILKLGAQGCVIANSASSEHVPGFAVTPLDTTAAGDTFNAAFATALSEERPVRDGVRFAHAAAAISVTRRGAQTSIPTRDEVEAFLRTH